MHKAHPLAVALVSMVLIAAAYAGAPATDKPAAAADKPTAKPPDLLKDAVDPFNLIAERAKFFTAAGPDSELAADEFAASKGQPNAFVRKFETFQAMLAFDKSGNKTLDWFEVKAYREDVRARVLAAFDANKDGKLAGAERDKANRALAAGRVPGGAPVAVRRAWAEPKPQEVKRYDADADGKLSTEERRALWKARSDDRRKEMLAKYDANKNGELDPPEREAMVREMTDKWMARLHDRNHDGQIDEAEAAEIEKAKARLKQAQAEWQAVRKEMLAKHDADGNGKLEGEERKAMWADLRQRWLTKQFDADGDGEFSEAEAKAMEDARAQAKAQYERWRAGWVKKYDTDGDGQLSEQEKQAAGEDLRQEFAKLAQNWRDQWDTDGDGQISPEERQAMRAAVRLRVAELKKEIDADGDGRITGPEMGEFLKKLRTMYDRDEDGTLSPEETKEMIQDQMRRFRGGAATDE